jgi:hypothetical protein
MINTLRDLHPRKDVFAPVTTLRDVVVHTSRTVRESLGMAEEYHHKGLRPLYPTSHDAFMQDPNLFL